MADVQARHWWFAGRRQVIAAVLGKLDLPTDSEILEIGCGTGGNLIMLARFGHLQAVELDDTARAIAASLGICKVHAGSLPGPLPLEMSKFDLICMLDTTPHAQYSLYSTIAQCSICQVA